MPLFPDAKSQMLKEGKEIAQKPLPKAPMPAGVSMADKAARDQLAKEIMSAKPPPDKKVQAMSLPPGGGQQNPNAGSSPFNPQPAQAPITFTPPAGFGQKPVALPSPADKWTRTHTGQAPQQDTVSEMQKAVEQAYMDLIANGPRNTAAEEAAAKRASEAAAGQALADARARSGFAGFGLSGAASMQDADIRRKAAQDLTSSLLGIQQGARSEYQQSLGQAAQVGAAAASNQIERDAWSVALQQLEQEMGVDLNKDGVIAGADKAAEEQAKADQAAKDAKKLSGQALMDYAQHGVPNELTSASMKEAESMGVKYKYVRTQSDLFGNRFAVWVDQFGNERIMKE